MIRCIGLAFLLLLLPQLAPGQVTAKKVDPAAVRAKLVQGQYIDGTVAKLEEGKDEHKLIMHCEIKTPNPAGYKKYLEVATRYNLALEKRSTSLTDIEKLQQELKQARQAAFIVEETPLVFQLAAPIKTTIYRTLVEPKAGVLKPKLDPRYPGYVAKFEDVALDLNIRVYLNKAKLKTGAKMDEDTIYPVNMIVIVPASDPIDDLKPVPLK